MLTLTLLSAALAHTPHDATVFVALDPTDPSPRVLTGFSRGRYWYHLWSDDGGWDWQAHFATGFGAGVRDGAWLDADTHALATDGAGLILSTDGRSWSPAADIPGDEVLEVVRAAPDGRGLALAAGERVYRSLDGGERWLEIPVPLTRTAVDIAWSPGFAEDDTVCLAGAGGQVFCSEDAGETWSPRLELPIELWALSLGADGTIYLAAGEGGLLALAPGESEAFGLELDTEWVGAVGAFDGVLLAAGEFDLWRSTDGGASFQSATRGLDPAISGRGSPPSGGHYYSLVEDGAGLLYLAAWEGLYASEDRGATWAPLPVVEPLWHHRVQIVDADGAPRVVMPSYGGGGLSWIDLAGEREVLSAAALGCCQRQGMVSEEYLTDGEAWISEGGNLWGTTDGGISWVDYTLDGPLDYVENIAVEAAGAPAVLIGGEFEKSLDLAWTDDGGATWERPGLARTLDARYVLDVAFSPDFREDGRMYVTTEGPWLLRSDGGAPFEAVWGGDDQVEPIRLFFEDAETIWASTYDGLYLGGPDGDFAPAAFEGRLVTALAIDGEERWAALVDELWRSTDGGATWAQAPESPPGPIHDLALSPTFSEDGLIAAAGWDGVWISRDAGASWLLASNHHTLDITHEYWTLDDSWQVVGDVEGAYLRTTMSATAEGASGEVVFRGDEIALRALCGRDQGAVEVSLDGGEYEEVSLRDGEGVGRAWCAATEPGWHTLSVRAARLPVKLDGIEVRSSEGLALPITCPQIEEEGEAGGGCREGGASWLLLPLLLAARPRRRA